MGKALIKKHPKSRRGMAYWFIIIFVISAAFWVVNKAWTHINQTEVAAYVKTSALDVIELKNGRKSIGKIVGETPKSYFIKNTKGVEEKIDRNAIKIKRTATNEELEIARVLLTKNINRSAAERMTAWEKVCCAVGSVANRIEGEAKYFKEVAAAREAKANLERKLAEERAKEQGAEEGLSIEERFLQWAQSGGAPAKKKE